jgi:hypothetical protein
MAEKMSPHHLFLRPPAAAPKEIVKEEHPIEMVPEQEAPVVLEVVLVDAEPKMPKPCHHEGL